MNPILTVILLGFLSFILFAFVIFALNLLGYWIMLKVLGKPVVEILDKLKVSK